VWQKRQAVLELTNGKCWKKSSYFTQTLRPDFLDAQQDLRASWDVVFDDRGHLIKPYTQHRVGLGSLDVRGYIRRWHAAVPSDDGPIDLDPDCLTMGTATAIAMPCSSRRKASIA
jgi:hypothetical protein